MRSLRFCRREPWGVAFAALVVDIASHSSIQWTQDSAGVAIKDVRIDLGRGDIPVPEQLLDGPDVIAHFEQMGCERMPQGVRAQ